MTAVATLRPARPVEQKQPRSTTTAIHAVADRLEPRYRRAFLEAVQRLKSEVKVSRLLDAIRAQDTRAIMAMLALDQLEDELRGLVDAVLDTYRQGAQFTATEVERRIGIRFAFDMTDPDAIGFVQRHGAELVREISDETRAAIRDEILRGFTQERTAASTARVLRRRIGLTRYQMRIVANYEAALRAAVAGDLSFSALRAAYTLNPVRGAGGLLEGRIQSAVRQYEARLLKLRAQTIARTETIRAAEAGRQEAWRQAQKRDLLAFDQQREWLTADDERTCSLCLPLDGVRVALYQSFPGGIDSPPRHPSCRCTTVLVFDRR